MVIAFLSSLSSEIRSLSNTFGLSKELTHCLGKSAVFRNISCNLLNSQLKRKTTCSSLSGWKCGRNLIINRKILQLPLPHLPYSGYPERKVGATISFVSGSRVSSTLARYSSISSFVRSVPRSALIFSGSKLLRIALLFHCAHLPFLPQPHLRQALPSAGMRGQ